MNRFDIMNYISERYDVEPQYLWDTYPDYAVFVILEMESGSLSS